MADAYAANEATIKAIRAEGQQEGRDSVKVSSFFSFSWNVMGPFLVACFLLAVIVWSIIQLSPNYESTADQADKRKDNFQNLKKDKRHKKQRFSKQFKRLV